MPTKRIQSIFCASITGCGDPKREQQLQWREEEVEAKVAGIAKREREIAADKQHRRVRPRAVRVEGNLVKGSLVHQEVPCEYRFEMENGGAKVPSRFIAATSLPPAV